MRVYHFRFLGIELGLRCHMGDVHSEFEEDWIKTAATIDDDRYFGQTDTQTDRHLRSSDFISVQCIGQTVN